MYKILYVLIFIFFLCTCSKKKIKVEWQEISTNTSLPLHSIEFINDSIGYAVGGDLWNLGILLTTIDGGQNWQLDTLSNKILFSLKSDQNQNLYITGIDGKLFVKNIHSTEWTYHRLPRWDIMNSVCFYDENNGLIAGGQAYSNGVIEHVTTDLEVDTVHFFEYEINEVCYSDIQTAHAVGYGAIMRSEDAGYNWEILPYTGDYYQDICFPNSQIGYIIGNSGSILKTIDAGKNWETIQTPSKLSNKNNYRALHFYSEEIGIIVGNQGICHKTNDGGKSWQLIEDLPNIDLKDVFITSNKAWIVGEDGILLYVELIN